MQDKYSSLAPPMGILLSYSMSLTGCQINPIDVNFHHKKSLEIFDKNSADERLDLICREEMPLCFQIRVGKQ